MPGKYPTDPAIIEELHALRKDLKLTYKGLVQTLLINGVTETFLAKYMTDNLDRQVPNFEDSFRDIIKGIRERIAFGNEIFETSVSRRMRNCFELVRRTGDIALITSPAGNGKTSGSNAYLANNPSAIRITLNATTCEANKVESLVFRTIDGASWKSNTPRFDYLVERFREVSRLLIVDNAQRLSSSGRQWLFDFHDEANCPIVLVGNPETLGRIRTNDQQFSRIGMHATYELEEKELPAASLRVAQQFSDMDTAEAVSDLAACVAAHEGRLRSVKKQVILMQELRNNSASLRNDPRGAFRAAHARLVRDYPLPADK